MISSKRSLTGGGGAILTFPSVSKKCPGIKFLLRNEKIIIYSCKIIQQITITYGSSKVFGEKVDVEIVVMVVVVSVVPGLVVTLPDFLN